MAESNLFSRQLDNGTWEYAVKDGDVFQSISPADYKYRSEAEDASSLDAGFSAMGRRVLNAINTFLPESADVEKSMTAYPDMEREAMQREHPIADAIGGSLPYLAAVPAAIGSGGTLPAAMIAGAASGALFADKGDEGKDALIGGALPMVGGAAVKAGQKTLGAIKGNKKVMEIVNKLSELTDDEIKAVWKTRSKVYDAVNKGKPMSEHVGYKSNTLDDMFDPSKTKIAAEAAEPGRLTSGPNWAFGAARTAPIGLLDAREEAWSRRMSQ